LRILWLKTELLHPVDKGGKIRTYQMLKELKKEHHITYLTLDDGSASQDAIRLSGEYAHETITVPHKTTAKFSSEFYFELVRNVASPLPYALQKYVSREMKRVTQQIVDANVFDIAVYDFLTPVVNMPDQLEIPTLLFQHNVEAEIWRRHFENAENALKRAYFKVQYDRVRVFEREACKRFDRVVAVSKEDAETMERNYGVQNVSDVATGVDTEFFAPSPSAAKDPFNIVFTGSMDWLPNDDAIKWFTAEILPLIRARVPQVTLTVVGRNPSPSLLGLSGWDDAITVTGRVDDVRPYMEKASVYIVPIRIGGGTRLKIFEAMAMEIPVVSTAIGAEGLPVKDAVEIPLRDRPTEFADAVVQLLQQKQIARELTENAARKVRNENGWEAVAREFARHCEQAIKEPRRARSVTPETRKQAAAGSAV